jgi:two-component system, OmpR family, sensor kinase
MQVQDQGPGVLPEERERIFERFVRGSAAEHSERRGSGIGLSVVKLLMEAMGGSVRVADAPGGGADFQLWLPAATSSAGLSST